MDRICSLCHLTGLLNRHPYDLSGGEQQRAALAKVLLQKPQVLLLDEPTKGLDGSFKEILAGILKQLTGQGRVLSFWSATTWMFCAAYGDRSPCSLTAALRQRTRRFPSFPA